MLQQILAHAGFARSGVQSLLAFAATNCVIASDRSPIGGAGEAEELRGLGQKCPQPVDVGRAAIDHGEADGGLVQGWAMTCVAANTG